MIQILIAFLAGVLTIASPCVLPLLPILLGTSVGQTSNSRPLFIVLGFAFVFTVAGVFISVLTEHLGISANVFRDVAVVVLGIFGIFMIWPRPFELLTSHFSRIFTKANDAAGASRGQGNWGAFILGMTLGLVWTPCAGPVLGSILTLIAAQRDLASAGILLAAYSVGAGVPMLIIAYGGQYISTKIRSLYRYTKALQQVFGVIIILLAVAIYFNYDTKLYSILLAHYNIPTVTF